jgi:hypothetical protein
MIRPQPDTGDLAGLAERVTYPNGENASARRILFSAVVRHYFLAIWPELHVSVGLRQGFRFGSQRWRVAPKRWRAPQLSFEPVS